MRELFYRFAPWVLGTLGVLAVVAMYLMTFYFNGFKYWTIIMITAIFLGAILGGHVRNLRYSACTDHLTELWNRKYFNIRLAEELERARRSGAPLCIAMIDMDNFKGVNDCYGHVVGDELIMKIAKILKASTRTFDIVARWGGDEFGIIFPDTSTQGALAVAERMRMAVEGDTETYNVTLSIGILAVDGKTSVKRALEMVDHALYNSKINKNEITVWAP